VVTYPGTNNFGIVYAATFGRGLYRCNNFRKPVGVDEAPIQGYHSTNQILLFPNPARNQTTISFVAETGREVVYRIFDLNGRMIQSASLGTYPKGTQHVTIETTSLSKGTYILSLDSGAQVSTAKLIRY
jgi:hypothetical protein